ncbi:MAG: exodeoxyribonuclease VII small subunit [Candidatus Hydrogenedentes bacterium]|nr:exodeoxyribonuclease VII small subunit [Candidatus Hydrogenedentota bacterium]
MAEPKFEKDLERLESIVGALEEGGLSLDDALKRFEEGIKLAQRCEKALTEAEKKIEILVKNAEGQVEAQPFGAENGETGEAAPANKPPRKNIGADGEEEEGELLF